MDKPFVDLHIHSTFSDGGMSPEEVVEAAEQNNVGVLAITDHNILDGSLQAKQLCHSRGIHHIPAVELDALDNGINYHILAYGFNVENVQFNAFIKHTRFLLDESSMKLLERMRPDYHNFSFKDFADFSYDKHLGGWKMLHYLMNKGLTSSLKDGMKYYSDYGISSTEAGYSTIAATAYRIKMAGGYSVLAHPGEVIDTSDIDCFSYELKRIISLGIDGIECYYPTHSKAVTQVCLELCNEYDLLITAGSDCHGVFGRTCVGEMNICLDKLRLKNLAADKV